MSVAEIYFNSLHFNAPEYFPWKGKTLNQITSIMQKNQNTNSNPKNTGIFRAGPVKLYRREIFTLDNSGNIQERGNPRTSLSIDEFTRPNGYFISQNLPDCSNNGVVNYLDPKDANITTNIYDMGEICNTCNQPTDCKSSSTLAPNIYISQEFNAKRRVRSAGMITKKYNPARNGDSYSTSNSQYLVSRNRTFDQNQYNYIRQGNALSIPGDNLSVSNVYSAQGINHCEKYIISSSLGNNKFNYTWVDSSSNTVTIPNGAYSLTDFNAAFQLAMYKNTHYYINQTNQTIFYLLNFAYNTNLNTVEIQSFEASGNSLYIQPPGSTWISRQYFPQIVIQSTNIQSAIGFTLGTYPSSSGTSTTPSPQLSESTINPAGLQPVYVPVIYKPNNSQFAQQGGVSSSTRIARLKYDTITTVGATYRSAYGAQVANELAYGVAPTDAGYTLKTALGYPLKCTPQFDAYTGAYKACRPSTFLREFNLYV
jgi:hypothetical protein